MDLYEREAVDACQRLLELREAEADLTAKITAAINDRDTAIHRWAQAQEMTPRQVADVFRRQFTADQLSRLGVSRQNLRVAIERGPRTLDS